MILCKTNARQSEVRTLLGRTFIQTSVARRISILTPQMISFVTKRGSRHLTARRGEWNVWRDKRSGPGPILEVRFRFNKFHSLEGITNDTTQKTSFLGRCKKDKASASGISNKKLGLGVARGRFTYLSDKCHVTLRFYSFDEK